MMTPQEALQCIVERREIAQDDMLHLMRQIMRGELSPVIEQRLLGLSEGTRTTFALAAGEAFGQRNPELVQWVARKLLNELGGANEPYQVGDVVQFPTPDGMGQYAGSVQQVKSDGEAVLFDFNHPLAGQPVVFVAFVIGAL